jgi:hypothetical protein
MARVYRDDTEHRDLLTVEALCSAVPTVSGLTGVLVEFNLELDRLEGSSGASMVDSTFVRVKSSSFSHRSPLAFRLYTPPGYLMSEIISVVQRAGTAA